ncbi:MAG: hypothetical protein AAFX85_03605 [Pseudomonadota bacterium]
MRKEENESDDFESDEDFTDTDLFDPETIAAELESLQKPTSKRDASSARAAIEEMVERKRLRRAIEEFDDDDFDLSLL